MCPACHKPMVSFEFDGVEVDRCLECSGTWLDTGELELLAELAGVRADNLVEALEQAVTLGKDRRRCPSCPRRLQLIEVGKNARVELDRCPGGHGLWFDRGEMETLIDSFSDGVGGAVSRYFAELYRSERHPAEGDS